MKRLLADSWFQSFAALAVMSGLVMAAEGIRFPAPSALARLPATADPSTAATQAPASNPQTRGGSAAAPVAAGPIAPALPWAAREAASRAEAAARGSPENYIGAGGVGAAAEPFAPARGGRMGQGGGTPAGLPIFKIAAKKRGRWVVSAAGGVDVDSPSIARAIYSAADGDVVAIRPGKYSEIVAISHKSLTLRGEGPGPDAVVLAAPVRVDHATVQLENLRIEPQGGDAPGDAALSAESAKVTLKRVIARSGAVAVRAEQGDGDEVSLRIVSSQLDGGYADLLARGRARLALEDDRFFNAKQPIVVWRDAHLAAKSCRFAGGDASRIYAYEDSSAAVSGSSTSPRVSSRRSSAEEAADRAHLGEQAQSPRRLRVAGPAFLYRR